MIKELLGLIFISVIILLSIKFSLKILNKKVKKKQELYEKEFEDGNILFPIDERDFENLEEFKKKTDHIPKVKEKLDTIKEDFNNFESIMVKKDIENKEEVK